jgi:hypothetical protein
MANQLYAAPIIIEAFQTGKAELGAGFEIQTLNEAVESPNNGPSVHFGGYSTVRLDKGIILIVATYTGKTRNFMPEIYTGFLKFSFPVMH